MLKETIERQMKNVPVTRPMRRKDLADLTGIGIKQLGNIMKRPETARLDELDLISSTLQITTAELVSGNIKDDSELTTAVTGEESDEHDNPCA